MNRLTISITLLQKLTDEFFARRRKMLYDISKKYSQNKWENFDDSLDDFEARSFAFQYQHLGRFVRDGLVDKKTMMAALQGIVVTDWRAFEPIRNHMAERFKGIQSTYFPDFQWLAEETRRYLQERGMRL